MSPHENERPPEREFMTKRYKVKKGKRLLKSQAELPEILTDTEKKEYMDKIDEEERMEHIKVVQKGEQFTEDSVESANPEKFNQQVSDEDLAALRKKCTLKQFVQVENRLFLQNDINSISFRSSDSCPNSTSTWMLLTPTSQRSARKCRVWSAKCLVVSVDKRDGKGEWSVRSIATASFNSSAYLQLHGCYPQEKLTKFQHKQLHQQPTCYFVNARKRTLTSDRYLDVMNDFDDINFHLTGKERVRVFRRNPFINPPEPDHSDSDSDSDEENGREEIADEKVEKDDVEQNNE